MQQVLRTPEYLIAQDGIRFFTSRIFPSHHGLSSLSLQTKGRKAPSPPPANWTRCHGYLTPKFRCCRQLPAPGTEFCGTHQPCIRRKPEFLHRSKWYLAFHLHQCGHVHRRVAVFFETQREVVCLKLGTTKPNRVSSLQSDEA